MTQIRKTFKQWLLEKSDIVLKVGRYEEEVGYKITSIGQAILEAIEVNDQTGLTVLVLNASGKPIYFIDNEAFIEEF